MKCVIYYEENFVSFFLTKDDDDEIIGVANLEFETSNSLYCSRIKILEDFRGNGYSKILLQNLKEYAMENDLGIYLHISTHGLGLQVLEKLYKSYGFQLQADGSWLLDYRKEVQ